MTDLFGQNYADTYDIVYRDKDYASECDAIARLFDEFARQPPRQLLDLGSGTGGHALILAERGFEVFGIDQSAAMIEHAQRRTQGHSRAAVEFAVGDIRDFSVDRRFDAALIMFSVLGYMASNDDLLAAFATTRRHVRDGGLLIADVWYGPAVVADPPRDRHKEIQAASGSILRTSSVDYRPDEQLCAITIRTALVADNAVRDQSEELHLVRYFFPLELDLALRASGFRLLSMRSFPDVAKPAGVAKWPAALIAVAV